MLGSFQLHVNFGRQQKRCAIVSDRIFILESAAQVESLSGGKSMESIKSTAISDAEPAPVEEEKWYNITIQVFIPFMIAGVGTIGAGIVLGNVEVVAPSKTYHQ